MVRAVSAVADVEAGGEVGRPLVHSELPRPWLVSSGLPSCAGIQSSRPGRETGND